MRVMFVPVANRPECARALRTAFDLGKRLDASLVGCHIRPHRHSAVDMPDEFDSLADFDESWASVWKGKKTQRSGATAKALFAKVAAQNGYDIISNPSPVPGAVWLEKVGSPDIVLSIQGPVSDLAIVTRPAAKGGKIARMFMLAALMNSSKPVLVLPHSGSGSIGRRISIAWNQSAEAARAVSAVLPLLQQAEHVNIVSFGSESAAGPKSTQLATYLKFWGVKSSRSKAHGKSDSQALLKAHRESRSDLLVMGAYSRSRLRQRIFGGVTNHMLYKADIPVLMLHS